MKDVKDIVACVIDHGQHVTIARAIGRQVKKCYYWTPMERAWNLIQESVVGDGFPEIIRIKPTQSFWDIKSECDLFVCPDIGFAGEQRELIRQGYPVWGARGSDTLESNRGKFLKTLERLKMKVPEYETIKGLTNLRLHLKDKEDKYIKMSDWRGNFETIHWVGQSETGDDLDWYATEFGPLKEMVVFYVFDPIEAEIEDAIDAYCIDGQYPKIVLHGMECKDKSHLGRMTPWDELPEETRCVNEDFAPALSNYRGFFGTEVRITPNKESYFIDATCRAGSPPHQMMVELFSNLADIMWHGANGICIDPIASEEFAVQAMFRIDRSEWRRFKLSPAIEKHVHIGFTCVVDGMVCMTPDLHKFGEIGWLCATGSTIEYAIHNLQEYAKEMPSGVEIRIDSLVDLLKEAEAADEAGMPFADEVPEPSTIVE